jgi:type II secretory pathway pseudopilin PulG
MMYNPKSQPTILLAMVIIAIVGAMAVPNMSAKDKQQAVQQLNIDAALTLPVARADRDNAEAKPAPDLFRPTSAQGALYLDNQEVVLRHRFVEVDRDLLIDPNSPNADRLSFNLFVDSTYTAVRVSVEHYPYGRTIWVGQLEGVPYGEVILTISPETVFADITLPGARYQVQPAGKDIYAVIEVDPTIHPPHHDPLLPSSLESTGSVVAPTTTPGTILGGPAATPAVPADIIDIRLMVLWTPAAREQVGGVSPMLDRIATGVYQLNQAATHSYFNVNLQFVLAHAQEVNYAEWWMQTSLECIQRLTDNCLDEIHTLRAQSQAHIVSLWTVETQPAIGMAYVMPPPPSKSFEDWAFNVVNVDWATLDYTFAHEVGHNMGAEHDRGHASRTPSYPWAYGFQNPSCPAPFYTIMSYPDGCANCQHILWYSHPDAFYYAIDERCRTGVPHPDPNSAFNADAIRANGAVVASFEAFYLDAQFVGQSVPTQLTAGQRAPVSITMYNAGARTWTEDTLFRLGTQNPQDNSTWGTHRVLLPTSVPPGGTVTLNFTITAPSTPGTYDFQWRMVRDLITWFGAVTPNVAIVVTQPPDEFQDVPSDHPFYAAIACLSGRDIVSGYRCGGAGEPCVPPANQSYFRPGNAVTRSQLAKIVSNAAGFTEGPGPQRFGDVPTAHPYFTWINRMAIRGLIGGYPCGTRPDEPCVAPQDLEYYRPSANATRGQITKIVSNGAGYNDPSVGQIFQDVPPEQAFYIWVQRLASRDVVGGYPCGGENEPCGAENKPYFRWGNNATRGQVAKITSNTFFPNCQTP